MVRVIAGMPALLAASLQLTDMTEVAATQGGMTLELHRMPDHGIHPETYARRRLDTASDELELVPLHLGLGTHYTWVYAGTPPQRASVITDTGSGMLAFPCSGCDGCGEHTDEPFVASNSSTLVHVTCSSDSFFQCKECQKDADVCDISQSYMEGSSWKASVVEDIVYLGGDASFDDETLRNRFGTHFQFGCQRSATGLFITQVADGIMGLSNADDHIVAKLHRENKIPNKLFSLCFAEQGGAMTLGTVDTSRHQGDVAYAKVVSDRSDSSFYNVRMKDIRIGGKSIEANASAYTRGRYIVDSGTTDSYLPRLLKREFMQVFEEVAGKAYQVSGNCNAYSEEDVAKLPTIQFVMEADDGGETTLDITPEQYLLHQGEGYCGGIFLSEHSGGVIGANLMMNRDVIFDGGNQRVGFVDANCSYEAPMQQTETPVKATMPPVDESSAGSSVAGEEINLVPTKTTAATPTPVDTSALTATSTPAHSTVAPTPEPSTTPPATNAPTATEMATSLAGDAEVNATTTPFAGDAEVNATEAVEAATTHSSSNGSEGEEKHPLVLQLVGAVLVVAFLLVVVMAVRRRKRNAKKQAWSRVNRSEEDGDAADDEEEFGLVSAHDRRTPEGRPQRVATSSPAASAAPELSSDEEDEIFDRDAAAQHETKLDAGVLERL